MNNMYYSVSRLIRAESVAQPNRTLPNECWSGIIHLRASANLTDAPADDQTDLIVRILLILSKAQYYMRELRPLEEPGA